MPLSGKIIPYACRADHKHQNEWLNIKIEQQLPSEMSKELYKPWKYVKHAKVENFTKSLKITHFGVWGFFFI